MAKEERPRIQELGEDLEEALEENIERGVDTPEEVESDNIEQMSDEQVQEDIIKEGTLIERKGQEAEVLANKELTDTERASGKKPMLERMRTFFKGKGKKWKKAIFGVLILTMSPKALGAETDFDPERPDGGDSSSEVKPGSGVNNDIEKDFPELKTTTTEFPGEDIQIQAGEDGAGLDENYTGGENAPEEVDTPSSELIKDTVTIGSHDRNMEYAQDFDAPEADREFDAEETVDQINEAIEEFARNNGLDVEDVRVVLVAEGKASPETQKATGVADIDSRNENLAAQRAGLNYSNIDENRDRIGCGSLELRSANLGETVVVDGVEYSSTENPEQYLEMEAAMWDQMRDAFDIDNNDDLREKIDQLNNGEGVEDLTPEQQRIWHDNFESQRGAEFKLILEANTPDLPEELPDEGSSVFEGSAEQGESKPPVFEKVPGERTTTTEEPREPRETTMPEPEPEKPAREDVEWFARGRGARHGREKNPTKKEKEPDTPPSVEGPRPPTKPTPEKPKLTPKPTSEPAPKRRKPELPLPPSREQTRTPAKPKKEISIPKSVETPEPPLKGRKSEPVSKPEEYSSPTDNGGGGGNGEGGGEGLGNGESSGGGVVVEGKSSTKMTHSLDFQANRRGRQGNEEIGKIKGEKIGKVSKAEQRSYRNKMKKWEKAVKKWEADAEKSKVEGREPGEYPLKPERPKASQVILNPEGSNVKGRKEKTIQKGIKKTIGRTEDLPRQLDEDDQAPSLPRDAQVSIAGTARRGRDRSAEVKHIDKKRKEAARQTAEEQGTESFSGEETTDPLSEVLAEEDRLRNIEADEEQKKLEQEYTEEIERGNQGVSADESNSDVSSNSDDERQDEDQTSMAA